MSEIGGQDRVVDVQLQVAVRAFQYRPYPRTEGQMAVLKSSEGEPLLAAAAEMKVKTAASATTDHAPPSGAAD
jgi:hypothetical protein